MKFYSKNIKDNKIIIITLLFIIPFISSFNLMRNSLAASLGLLAITSLKENKTIKFFLLSISSFLIHYTGIVLILLYLFIFFRNKIDNQNKRPILMIFITILFGTTTIGFFTNYLLKSKYYLYLNLKISLLGYLPLLLLLILVIVFYDDLLLLLKKDNNVIHLNSFIFSVSCLPFVLKGAARFLMYFDFSRYILWGYIILVIKSKVPQFKNNRLLEIISFILIICWIIFRLYRNYYPDGIMPYYNELFNN